MKRTFLLCIILIVSALTLQTTIAALPNDIQVMLTTIDKEAIDFPSRARQLVELQKMLADGQYDLARFEAECIIKQQNNLRSTKEHGAPSDLKQNLTTIEKKIIDYPSRARQLVELQKMLADGQYDLARFQAESIIKQQRNLRNSK